MPAEGTLRANTRILIQCAAATARRLVTPWLLALAATGLALFTLQRLDGTDRDAAAGLWLHMPCFLLAVAGIGAALDAWPLMSRDRRGARFLARLRPPGADGCVAATAGSVIAVGAALAAAAMAFCGLLALRGDLPSEPRTHIALEVVQPRPILDADHRRLDLRGPADAEVSELRLRPLVFLEDGRLDSLASLRISADGHPLHASPLDIAGSHETISVTFPARTVPAIEVMAEGDQGLALYFPHGAIEAVLHETHDAMLNAILAACSYLWPFALALALATLARRHVGLPVSLVTGVMCVIAFTLFGWMPNTSAIADFAERRWLPTESFWAMGGISLGIVVVLMVFALVTPAQRSEIVGR